MFILDTDHLGIIQGQYEPDYSRLMTRVSLHHPDELFCTIVSFHEQVLGWNAYIARARNIEGIVRGYEKFEKILQDFSNAQVLPFDAAAAQHFQSLRQSAIRTGTMDLRIAAIALARSMTVLTRNTTDFARVPGLKVEDWTL